MKKVFGVLIVICALALLPSIVSAANITVGATGSDYATLPEAIAAATDNDVIILNEDVELSATQRIEGGKKITIDLNEHYIAATQFTFRVCGGELNVIGNGIIKENSPNLGAIVVIGSETDVANFSVVRIGQGVTLEAWAPVFIDKGTAPYGVVVDFNGTAVSKPDGAGDAGSGIYINGTIKNKTSNYPLITVGSTAVIISAGPGIYAAGYADWTFRSGASITGVDSAIAMKAGKFTINGGTFLVTGENSAPTTGWSNGVNASGATIQIESSSDYAGDIDLTINGGVFNSKNGHVIYEYIGKGTETAVSNIKINGGIFNSESRLDIFLLSEKFGQKFSEFVNGGTFSSDPTDYLKSGLFIENSDGMFKVTTEDPNLNNNTELKDGETGLTVIADVIKSGNQTYLPSELTLTVGRAEVTSEEKTKYTNNDVLNKLNEKFANSNYANLDILDVLDISIFVNDTETKLVDFSDGLTIRLPYDAEKYGTENLCVVFIGDNGEIEIIPVRVVEDGVIEFTVYHLSEYVLAQGVAGNNEESPNTGDINLILLSATTLIAVVGTVVFTRKLKSKNA